MRTTINVDEELFEDLLRLTGGATKTEAIRVALQEFIRLKKKEELLGMRGKLDLKDNWRLLRDLEVPETRDSNGD